MNRVVLWERGAPPLGQAVAAIGVFDGVHIGHQALLGHAACDAADRGRPCIAVTFDRDPDQVVTPEAAAPQLLPVDDKCRFLLEAGADRVLVIPFDAELAALPPLAFLDRVLMAALEPLAIHVGIDFRFGRFAQGTVDTLATAGEDMGFDVRPHVLVEADGAPVTSTRIRHLVAAGDVAGAARLLGKDHRVSGRVDRGRGAGRAHLGVPTANLVPPKHAAIPADGVYAGWAEVGSNRFPAALSAGIPPTFPKARHRLEAHVIGLGTEVYGETVTVGFTRRLRDQLRFGDDAELAAAIRNDIAQVARDAGATHPSRNRPR